MCSLSATLRMSAQIVLYVNVCQFYEIDFIFKTDAFLRMCKPDAMALCHTSPPCKVPIGRGRR